MEFEPVYFEPAVKHFNLHAPLINFYLPTDVQRKWMFLFSLSLYIYIYTLSTLSLSLSLSLTHTHTLSS